MAYPATIDTFAARTDGVDQVVAADINVVYTALESIMTELGTDPAGTLTDVKTRLAVSLTGAGYVAFQAATGLTISGGAITVSRNVHTVDTEGAAASDDLDTINGTATGFWLILRTTASARDIVVKHGTGNITCAGAADFTLSDITQFAYGYYDAGTSTWYLAHATDASGGSGTVTASGTTAGEVAYMSTATEITSNAGLAFTTANGLVGNEAGGTAIDFRWESDNDTHALFVDASADKVTINDSTAWGKLTIHQTNAAGAYPVLSLDQDDQDFEFLEFLGTEAADQTKNISTVNGDGAVDGPKLFSASAGWQFVGMIKIAVNGADFWMPYYTPDTA
jgi:hypothetical protein